MFENADTILDEFSALLVDLPTEQLLRGSVAPGRKNDVIAVDADGRCLVLVRRTDESPTGLARTFESLQVIPSGLYAVDLSTGSETHDYAALILSNVRRDLLSSFALIASGLLASLSDRPNSHDIEKFIDSFVSMFRVTPAVERDVIKGIWGELWLLNRAEDSTTLAAAWHQSPLSLFDFSLDNMRIEVKTHEGVRPEHWFSHEQIVVLGDSTTIVSLRIAEDAAGATIADLIESVSSEMTLPQRADLLRKVAAVLGTAFERARDDRFVLRGTVLNNCIKASDLPRVTIPAGAPISGVNYKIDLTSLLYERGTGVDALLRSLEPSSRP